MKCTERYLFYHMASLSVRRIMITWNKTTICRISVSQILEGSGVHELMNLFVSKRSWAPFNLDKKCRNRGLFNALNQSLGFQFTDQTFFPGLTIIYPIPSHPNHYLN